MPNPNPSPPLSRIGGARPAQRNLISGNYATGIAISSGERNAIQGNYIGTNAAGTAVLANAGYGIALSGGGTNVDNVNLIGGLTLVPGTPPGNVSGVYTCVQVKPTAAKCRLKAAATCSKQRAKLTSPGTGAAAKLAAAIAKSCTKAPFALTDLLADGGLRFTARAGECTALGVPSLGSLAEVSTCLERQHVCRVEQMIETEMPRVEELVDLTP